MNTSTLLMRAAFQNVAEEIRDAYSGDSTPQEIVANALENIDWQYFDGLDDETLCEHVAHDFDASSCGTVCYHCGAERSRSNGGIS